ncbi:hypothetical protein Agub_g15425, partial [Astrephomene gubernaculifera]
LRACGGAAAASGCYDSAAEKDSTGVRHSLRSSATTSVRQQQRLDGAGSPGVYHGPDGRMVMSRPMGQLEVALPEPRGACGWSEAEFSAARFDGGAGGRVMVCTGSKCQRRGAAGVLRAANALAGGNPAIQVAPCKCLGKCSAGAALRVKSSRVPQQLQQQQGEATCATTATTTYTEVRPADLSDVFERHFAPAAAPAVAT